MGQNSDDQTDDLPEEDDGADAGASSGRKRDRSQIAFTYSDEERAAELANALQQLGGSAWIEQSQLAVALNQTSTGGTFRGRLGAARMFGFVETDQRRVRLTDLGLRLTDPQTAAAARADGFENVPLFREMYSRYQGYALPPAAAIERQMEQLGVPPKQKERARQAFAASAQYAGYIAANGRFSRPVVSSANASVDAAPVKEEKRTGDGGGNGGGGDLPPFIKGLLEKLPEPGSDWSVDERVTWLRGAEIIFQLMYKNGGEITIAVVKNKEPPKGGPE